MQEKNSQLRDPMSSLEDKNSLRCETISFNYVLRLSKILSQKIRGSGYVPDIIVAIGRGGYVPGTQERQKCGQSQIFGSLFLWI